MKKIYKVNVERCDCEGHYTRPDIEYVRTERIAEYIEAKKAKIEKIDGWWMGYQKGADNRPEVTAVTLAVKEV